MKIGLGLEQYLDDWIAIRGGDRYGANFTWDYDRSDLSDPTGSANYSAWTAGAGVKYDPDQDSFVRSILLDYAAEYRDVGTNDWQHVVSLSRRHSISMRSGWGPRRDRKIRRGLLTISCALR